jgi:hypothetical protein
MFHSRQLHKELKQRRKKRAKEAAKKAASANEVLEQGLTKRGEFNFNYFFVGKI